jgi:hypothetical protein
MTGYFFRNFSHREKNGKMALKCLQIAITITMRDSQKNCRGSGAVAAAFFSRTLKNYMNLVEFQYLQMKHPEAE